jgi:aryl-alcohol dehydrogenase-like predicted oxidoreductase
MEQRALGSLQVSLAGLGTNNFGMRIDHDQSLAVMRAALDEGVTFFDTADVYSSGTSEEWLAEAIGSRRGEVVIATKFGWYEGAAPNTARVAFEGSLRRLRTDYVDVLYCHRPDPTVPPAETVGFMGELVAAGKVREIGCSNVTAADVAEWIATADSLGLHRPACVEDQYNVVFRKPEEALIPECVANGMTFVPFFPLASGLLTGKYRLGAVPDPESRLGWGLRRVARETGRSIEELTADADGALAASMNWHPHERYDVDLRIVAGLEAIARETGRTMTELALGWLAAQPSVPTIIAGATSPEQARANARACAIRLTDDEVAAIDRLGG